MKKNVSILITGIIFAMFSIGCDCDPELIGSVSNDLEPQETANWCWAAVTQMLAANEGINIEQCDLANHRFEKTNCCDPENTASDCPKTNDCNTPGWLELEFAGVSFSESGSALSWEDIRDQIFCKNNTLGYAYGTPGVVGHVVVIKGYFTVNNTNYVVLNDPWSPCVGTERVITYAEYENPAGSGTHWNTWYDLDEEE